MDDVPLGVITPVAEKVIAMADEYAAAIVASLHTAESEEQLLDGISGAMISFLVDALSIA